MWVLLFIIISNGTPIVVLLPTESGQRGYPTEVACEVKRVEITMNMMKAYPGDTDYHLECRKVGK